LIDLDIPLGHHWEQAVAEATSRGHSEIVSMLISRIPPGQGSRRG
jgi:hypothetical protein